MKTINRSQIREFALVDLRDSIQSSFRRALLDLTQAYLSLSDDPDSDSALPAATSSAIFDLRKYLESAICGLTIDSPAPEEGAN